MANWPNRTLVGKAGESAVGGARDGWGWGAYVACGTADGDTDAVGLALGAGDTLGCGVVGGGLVWTVAGVEVAVGVGPLGASDETGEGPGALA